jgi:hypothetical protein
VIVVVGGHSRNIGKTSVAAGIVRTTPEYRWTALKITQFGHGLCTRDGHGCECDTGCDGPYTLTEDAAPNRTDSGRFLAAGAERSFWLRTPAGALKPAVPAIERILRGSPNAIIESNSVLEYLTPDLYLFVADPGNPDMKDSARRFLPRADALVLSGHHDADGQWPCALRFPVFPPDYENPRLTAFILSALSVSARNPA